MKRQTAIIFYLLGIYAVLQFAWWGFHLIQLTEELKPDSKAASKREIMIIGEGLVFFAILLFGLWKIRSSIKKELNLSQRQNNFLLSVTHELKTPLAANKLYLQTVQKRDLDEQKQKDLIEKAIQENERLENLIDNILNASRLENNVLKPFKTNQNLSDILEKTADRFQKRYQKNFIELHIQKDLYQSVDTFFIETILNNLIENAVKYAETSQKIEIYLYSKEDKAVFGVKDYGMGIPKEMQTQIFEKFYRIGNEETRLQKGSGLGLFIAAELARIHGGKIEYKENIPTGAIFEITL